MVELVEPTPSTSELANVSGCTTLHFKPEYRDLLPISDEEEELKLESELLTLHIFNLQQEEKNEEKVEIVKVERTAENSPMNAIIVEKPQETKADLCKFLSIGKHFDEHGASERDYLEQLLERGGFHSIWIAYLRRRPSLQIQTPRW
ncbi:hypothetical protein QL285_025806 [Trifolium repens]|nr:hypothetical protein QL285_025806 [Trifolium repens]